MAGELFFIPPDEKAKFKYEVKVQPPPADRSEAAIFKHEVGGEQIETKTLKTSGEDVLEIDISSLTPKEDSPIWVEFTFEKEGTDPSTSTLAFSLADPAVGTIEAPADGKVGETVEIKVATWGALAYDEPGEANFFDGVEASRIPAAKKSEVKWSIDGEERSETGETLNLTLEDAHAKKVLKIEAYIGEPTGEAVAEMAVPQVEIQNDGSEEELPAEVYMTNKIKLKAIVTPAIDGEFAWSCESDKITLTPDGAKVEVEGVGESASEGDVKLECKFTSAATGTEY